MSEKPLRKFSQQEYNHILDKEGARVNKLTQRECEKILMAHGVSYGQAKNGAYVYLHHSKHIISRHSGSREEYKQLLDNFDAPNKQPKECIQYLESLGFGYRQAQTAVYQYRKSKGLI
jgi:hypothetical protein